MNDNQVSIFEVISDTNYDKLLSKVSKYGIDDYYEKNIKGKSKTFYIIENELKQLPNFEEYQEELQKLLIDYFKDNYEIELLKNNGYLRIYEPRQSYTLFCLAMINKNIL